MPVVLALLVMAALDERATPPRCERLPAAWEVRGPLGTALGAVTEGWLKPAPGANPAIVEMFRDRDRVPLRALEPWAGEFAGKYLTGAVQVLRLTGDRALRAQLAEFVAEWVALQDLDGYLGPWSRGHRLTGEAPNVGGAGKPGGTWDAWGHYHALVGLLLWYEESGDARALVAARRIGDLFCDRFLGDRRPRLVDTGWTEMNLAPAHGLALLHRATGEGRYLALAQQLVGEFAAQGPDGKPLAGDYLRTGLAGTEFFQTPKPRWESLHPIMALAELHRTTGDESLRRAFEQHWWSIVRLDRHNNGGFSSGEQAQGNPYHPGAIETCCTVAWLALGVEMLRLTANPIVADELELTTLNSALGLWSPSGRWATYNTPMDGVRLASAHEIVFQSRAGSPELNCCSTNAARGLGLVSDWALMRDQTGPILNYYGPGTVQTTLAPDLALTLRQETDYPRDGRVTITVGPARAAEFTLKLRIPHWSARTTATLNGAPLAPVAGTYLTLHRTWQPGDRIVLDLDLSPHFWLGERECQGRVSAYRGPILLTWDRRFNDHDPAEIPTLAALSFPGRVVAWPGRLGPSLLLEVPTADGRTVRLCDFASAGQAGSPYRSWLAITGVPTTEFTRTNPLRTTRPAHAP